VRPGELEDPEVSSLLVKPRAERMVPWRACCGLAVGHWTSAAFSLGSPEHLGGDPGIPVIPAGAVSGATIAERLGAWLDALPFVAPNGGAIAIGKVR
jgi:hypothetical protein